jgi:hypothetical protein
MPLLLSDSLREKMLKAGGGISSACWPSIAGCLERRYSREGDECMLATSPTRKLVRKTRAYFVKGLECLTRLEANPEFQRYNRNASPDEVALLLDQWRKDRTPVVNLIDWLSTEQRRLARRSMKGIEDYLRSTLCTALLEIRTKSLGVDVPLQASETTTSGPFFQYLELGIRATEPYLKENKVKGAVKRATTIAIKGFNQRRTDPDYCLQWDDLFPKTSHMLFYDAFPDDSPLVPIPPNVPIFKRPR